MLRRLACVCCLSLLPQIVLASTIRVPADRPTIALGVASAFHGDTVLVAPGTYPEGGIDLRSGVVLTSEAGRDVTTIDGTGQVSPMIWATGSGPLTEISGFTLRGWYTGISAVGGSPVVRANLFLDLVTAVEAPNGWAHIEGNVFVDCDGGVRVYGGPSGTPAISHNTFLGSNDAIDAGGGTAAGVVITGNVIANGFGGVVCTACFGPITIECNDVWGNSYANYFGIADPTGTYGNISVDPLFCDPDARDLTLDSDSPCLPGQHPGGYDCGLIGALGVGCGGPTSAERASWGRVKTMRR